MAIIQTLLGVARSILSFVWRRQDRKVQAKRQEVDAVRLVGIELEKLADLMSAVLSATDPQGRIVENQLEDLDRLRKRSWRRWIEILSSGVYEMLSKEDSSEIEDLVRIAHAAPGAYVDEVFIIQKAISERRVPYEVRRRFADSVDRIKNKGVQLRLRK